MEAKVPAMVAITAEDAMNYADGIDYTHVGDKLCNYRRQSVEYLKKGIEQ